MPNVAGKKFPYTKAGKREASAAKTKKKPAKSLMKRTPAAGNYSRGY